MKELEQLIHITDTLLGPKGCPWDQEQTLKSLRPCIIEEACEVLEAIDLNDLQQIEEELGDFFFVAFFLCKVAEKEKQSTWQAILQNLNEKLIRRHPHVFGNTKIDSKDALLKQWTEIKSREHGKTHRKSALDGIPHELPALARAQKSIKKMHKAKFPNLAKGKKAAFHDEESLGKLLLEISIQAQEQDLDTEHALRHALTHLEKDFRAFEKES